MYTKLIAAMALATANANSVPVYATYPGWTIGGGEANIAIDFVWDYLCSDSLAAQPIIKSLLT